jgi:hypothetical protein
MALIGAARPGSALAQSSGGAGGDAPASVSGRSPGVDPPRGPWWTLWSWRTPHDRVIAGMITMHVYELGQAPTNNHTFGVIYHGVLGATFITTHGPRGFAAAFERAWLEGTLGPARTMLGFRAGLVYGYDRRLFELADHTPILPYGQPVLLVRAGPISLDLTYTWVVFSLTGGISLW